MTWQCKKIGAQEFGHYRARILEIYFEAASTGPHEQHLNLEKEANYVDGIFNQKQGYALVALADERCIGFILAYPFKHEPLLPLSVKDRYDVESCLYVAEMHVDRAHRGKGCGSFLFSEFLATVDPTYSWVAIRAWTNNNGALRFYERLSFVRDAIISETKIRKDNLEPFVIEKQYLFKKLSV